MLRVPRAEYRIDRTLALTNVADLVIDGQGSVVVLDSNTLSHIVLMTNAKRVTLRDIAFDMDPLPYTQGILIATGIVGDEAYYDIRVDQGYRSDLEFFQADNAGGFNASMQHTCPNGQRSCKCGLESTIPIAKRR